MNGHGSTHGHSKRDFSSRPPPSTVPRKRHAEAEEEAWIAEEDNFVLRQAKKKAKLRVKGGRAKPIDWLAVTLSSIDQTPDPQDHDEEEPDPEVPDPEGVFEQLNEEDLVQLNKDIESYVALEKLKSNKEFWSTMKIICNDRLQHFKIDSRASRGTDAVSSDIDKILKPKSFEELEKLEKQVRAKLASDGPIDTDYWEHLLRNLLVWKARARLKKLTASIIDARLTALREQQSAEAIRISGNFQNLLASQQRNPESRTTSSLESTDPEPMLKLHEADKSFSIHDESAFLDDIDRARQKVLKMGFMPATSNPDLSINSWGISGHSQYVSRKGEDTSQATTALYEREVARGVNENEEVFTNEESISVSMPQWSNKYKPRKPRYFNRVQLGYEWNKYNQTHYDHDNPPPKVVQGYKFNIFYPDLIDRSKAPTYKVEREGGRRRGQFLAPAGEDDTCLIKFIAGAPYEDIAFRIVDKEWDFSAKRERGFKSSFDKGILQLHFQFKKIYYRK